MYINVQSTAASKTCQTLHINLPLSATSRRHHPYPTQKPAYFKANLGIPKPSFLTAVNLAYVSGFRSRSSYIFDANCPALHVHASNEQGSLTQYHYQAFPRDTHIITNAVIPFVASRQSTPPIGPCRVQIPGPYPLHLIWGNPRKATRTRREPGKTGGLTPDM